MFRISRTTGASLDDAAQTGVPVGVQTHTVGELTVEVWYPAAEIHRGDASASIDIGSYLPDSVKEVLGTPELPPITTIAVRDATVRVPETPYPVVLFHMGSEACGFNPMTSPHTLHHEDIVAATEHSGRSIYDLLPCMFSPPLEGCNLSSAAARTRGQEICRTSSAGLKQKMKTWTASSMRPWISMR